MIGRISALIVFCLCLATGVKAQESSQHERKDFTFKVTKETNSSDEVDKVNLFAYAGKQLIKKYTYEVLSPLPKDLSETIGTISEDDINFDGYPDIDIYLGNVGAGANNTQHEALLWNQKDHCFEAAKGYNEIGEPQLDPEKKVIYTVHNSYVDVTTTYYRWEGCTLVEYLSNTWKMDDDKVPDFSDMLNLPLYRLDGKLNGRNPVIIAFQKDAEGIVAGYIYYPRAKNPAPIIIKGVFDDGTYDLYESLPDGTITGYICLKCDKDQNWSGAWAHPVTHKGPDITDIFFSHEAPKWFTKSLFAE